MSIAAAVLNAEAPVLESDLEASSDAEVARYEFDEEFQVKIVALQLRDQAFVARTDGLIAPAYFERETDGAIVKIVMDYFRTYKRSPDWSVLPQLIKGLVASKKVRLDMVPAIVERLREIRTVDISDRDYVVDQVADFARNKAIEDAMMRSIPALEKRDYATIQNLMSQAMLVGAHDEVKGYSYWGEIEGRTKTRIELASGAAKPTGIPTGIPEFDACLHHKGWGRKELSAFMGAAKAGKSMALGDFGKSASIAGYNVLYASCEVAADIIAMRTDANVSDIAIRILGANPSAVEAAVKRLSAGAGAFEILEFATGTLTCSMLRRVLQRYRARGIIFDLVIVDYADIMAPEHRLDEERLNQKQIWEGLRAIAFEENAAMLTATQSNREGAKAITAKGINVAEDYNKVRTCDVFITINATDADKANSEARLYFSEMRNSEGGFTLRIRQEKEKMRFLSKVLGRE